MALQDKNLMEEVEENDLITPVDEESISIDEIDENILGTMGVEFDPEDGMIVIEDEETFQGLVDENGMFEIETKKVDNNGNKIKKKVKARRKKSYSIGKMTEENFGPLLPFIRDINVTDINWNGVQLWIDDITKGRYISDVTLTKDFVETFSTRISNVVSRSFNKYNPRLEAETDELRVTVMHESVSHTGRAISIRKTPAVKRINFMESIRNGDYCSVDVANLMSNSVKARLNIIVAGLPGVGKTELVKFLTNYIFNFDRVITIEDTLEIHYKDINPDKDCLELKIDEKVFNYTDAIKSCLRLLPQWILLSEARSVEVKYLLESVSTGAKCITTIHTDDVRKIPDRVLNMIGTVEDRGALENTVYNFFNIGILIDKQQDEKTGKIKRWISQVCYFDREGDTNKCVMLVDDGELTGNKITGELLKKYNKVGIEDPFKYVYLDK